MHSGTSDATTVYRWLIKIAHQTQNLINFFPHTSFNKVTLGRMIAANSPIEQTSDDGEFPALVSLASSHDYIVPPSPEDSEWLPLPAVPGIMISRRQSYRPPRPVARAHDVDV
jgi:hypothetical protein